MFRCIACGELFETPKMIPESRGEYWGVPCCEEIPYSPCCEDDFVEGKMFYAEGKTYYYDEDEHRTIHVADFDGEYFAENDDESLYEEILFEERRKWGKKFTDDYNIDVDIEFWDEV